MKYKKTRFISSDLLEEVKEYCKEAETKDAGVSSGSNSTSLVNEKVRKTIKYRVNKHLFPELCEEIVDYFDGQHSIIQMDCLLYEEGCHFSRHIDSKDYACPMEWSIITLIDKSEDLKGGDLIIYRNEDDYVGERVELEVGESVIFKSNEVWHQISPVEKGWRNSLVTWIF